MLKIAQSNIPISTSKTDKPFELIFIHALGPFNSNTYDDKISFLTIGDDFTRNIWVYIMKFKYDYILIIRDFIMLIENQYGSSVKIVRTNNGGECVNNHSKDLFASKGILHQRTCPYTPQQNDMVERKHEHLLEIDRALKIQSSMPDKYWGECVLTSCYILNLLLSSVLNFISPYKKLYGVTPSLSHLHIFGCLFFGKNMNPQNKLLSRSIRSVILGYSLV